MRSLCASLAALLACVGLTAAVPNPAYAPAKVYGKTDALRAIKAIATGKGDTLMVATDKRILLYHNGNEKAFLTIDTGLPDLTTFTSDADTIYAFGTKKDLVEKEVKGRKLKIPVPAGVVCKRFTWDGKVLGEQIVPSIQDLTHARTHAGKIYLADLGTQKVRIFDPKTWAEQAAIGKDLRLCCGIFHFTVEPTGGDLILSNLGAFRVDRYAANGTPKGTFGKRGPKESDFHGCCNPVSTECLPGGNLVVVEKAPSRVNIVSKDGKFLSTFENLQELVEGCSMVSVATDSKGTVYLSVDTRQNHYVQSYAPTK